MLWNSPAGFRNSCGPWPRVTAEDLRVVREPLSLKLAGAVRADPPAVADALRRAALGPCVSNWSPPPWLLPHQIEAACRIAAILDAFRGALLSDAVGLGKTYVSLAVATRFQRVAAIVPAVLVSQWQRVSRTCRLPLTIESHEALSRGRTLHRHDLVIVDEAHRFRNPDTKRYDCLARGIGTARLLLVTATPVVNRLEDLTHLLRLFMPDHGLAILGVSSLAAIIRSREQPGLPAAAASLTVARTASLVDRTPRNLPRLSDGRVYRPPPLPRADLMRLVAALDRLVFPGFDAGESSHLLRAHLLHRLASSVPACRETLRRHLSYQDRALAALGSGERLGRGAARRLFGPGDDLQLLLGDPSPAVGGPRASVRTLEQERDRILALLQALPRGIHLNPKAERLIRLLSTRAGRRTIVFTTAVSTALDLARRTGWDGVAVVGAGRAWIASGRVSVEAVLDHFAPRARRAAEPGPIMRIDTLVATDLVSEGLDLQDADAIIHYDLPWTPLRLAQRVGRIARLGSFHSTAHVHWFGPPPPLERRLRLELRLTEKAHSQLQSAVPITSTMGKAAVVNVMLEHRERLAAHPAPPLTAAPVQLRAGRGGPRSATRARVAVVRGPPAVLAAVRWAIGEVRVPELLVLAGDEPTAVCSSLEVGKLLKRLEAAPPSALRPPTSLAKALEDLIRKRLQRAGLGPTDPATRSLRRRLLSQGAAAGSRRDVRLLASLDAALDHVSLGCAIGAERELTKILEDHTSVRALERWLASTARRSAAAPDCTVTALLFGDGSEPF